MRIDLPITSFDRSIYHHSTLSVIFDFASAETAKGAMDAEDGPFLDEDEDLGFDPFCESQRGLQDLLRGESNPGDVPDTGYSYGYDAKRSDDNMAF